MIFERSFKVQIRVGVRVKVGVRVSENTFKYIFGQLTEKLRWQMVRLNFLLPKVNRLYSNSIFQFSRSVLFIYDCYNAVYLSRLDYS